MARPSAKLPRCSAEEKPALLPLPVEPFRYYKYGERTVHLDGCVEVAAAYYGAPPGWIGRKVQVQFNDAHVLRIPMMSITHSDAMSITGGA